MGTQVTSTHTLCFGSEIRKNRYTPANPSIYIKAYFISCLYLRLYSEYYHEFGRLRPKFKSSPEHFHDIVVSGVNMYKECLKKHTLRSCVYDEAIYDKTVVSLKHVY